MGDTEPRAEEAAAPEGAPEDTIRARARYHLRQLIDHLWGPTGSVILHIALVVFLWRFMTFVSATKDPEIEVMMVEPDAKDLEEFKRELEKLPDEQPDIRAPDAEIVMERPETETFDRSPVDDQVAALDIRTDVQSPLIMKGLFSGRSAEGRQTMLKRFAGRHGDATESAVMRALEWLKNHQLADGSWSGESTAKSKTAMTGLALLCFLAHGETPSSERYGPTVEKAIRFLCSDLKESGAFTEVDGHWYAHGIASYALSEAYALTRIPAVKGAMEKCIGRIVKGQQPTGGFNYNISASDTRRDTSVMGWMTQAMKAAFIAGAEVEGLKEAIDKVGQCFRTQQFGSNNMFIYAGGGQANAEAGNGRKGTSAMATLCLQLIGQGGTPEAQAGVNALDDLNCVWGEGSNIGSQWTLYCWYYATQAKFHKGKQTWDNWNNQFARTVVSAQNTDGSWTPFTKNESEYGPVYGTAFCALTLMVYYRFLPTYQPIDVEAAAPATPASGDDVKVEVL